MSTRPNKQWVEPQTPARMFSAFWLIACLGLLIGTGWYPPVLHGQETNAQPATLPPLLVNARQSDTPATIARRYLNDAAKGWMIREYNNMDTLVGGETILIPRGPFRRGGLRPDGYQTVSVLAYSDIGPDSDEATRPPSHVSRSVFGNQMHWLKTEGFIAITPAQLMDFMDFFGQIPKRAVLITADTQSRAFFDLGVPILKMLGFTATVFVATDSVGREGNMTWDQIGQLSRDGFTVGCRGQSGRSLIRRTEKEGGDAHFHRVESELRLAKTAIETHLDVPCLFLAYPHGSTRSLLSAMAAKLGFAAGFIRSPGDTPFFADRFGIHRIAIDGNINAKQFASMLTTMITADLN